jgi:Tfp pilus assembly protein PilE
VKKYLKGFSLLEILTTLLVMVTISLIVIPAYNGLRTNSDVHATRRLLEDIELKQREHFIKKGTWGLTTEDLLLSGSIDIVSGLSTSPSVVSVHEYSDKSLGIAVFVSNNMCAYRVVYDPLTGNPSTTRESSASVCLAALAKQ